MAELVEVVVGVIGRAHGVRGEVAVICAPTSPTGGLLQAGACGPRTGRDRSPWPRCGTMRAGCS